MSIVITNELAPIEAPATVEGDHRKDCCKLATNLEYYYVANELTVLRCKYCGCRHFEVNQKPGEYRLKTIDSLLEQFKKWEMARAKDCCTFKPNLYFESEGGLQYFRCKVCGCRHFDIAAEPGVVGVKMT